MNRKLLLTLLILLPAATGYAQSDTGLIAHWPFNGNSNDKKTHVSVPHNITYGTGVNGTANTAAVFNGNSSYIDVAYRNDLNISDFTICAIVKPVAFYAGQCEGNVIIRRGYNYQGDYSLVYSDVAHNDCGVLDTSKMGFYPTGVSNTAAELRYTPTIATNNWYNVIATCRNDTMSLYVDGVFKFKFKTKVPVATTTQGLAIGASYNGTTGMYPYWLNGLIDDLRIYNRSLSDSEINAYNLIVRIATPDTVTCLDHPFQLRYTTNGSFGAGNVFRAELSDAAGSFATPTVIGTVTASTSGRITCIVPPGTPSGAGYRIRIVASDETKVSNEIKLAVNINSSPMVTINASGQVTTFKDKVLTAYWPSTVVFTAVVADTALIHTYKWRKNNVDIAGQTGAKYIATAGVDFHDYDSISVLVRNTQTCQALDSASDKILAKVYYLSVDDLNNQLNISAYPNPNTGSFVLKGNTGNSKNINITVRNAVGQLVYSEAVATINSNMDKTVSLNDVAAGIYTVQLASDYGTQTLKVHVQ